MAYPDAGGRRLMSPLRNYAADTSWRRRPSVPDLIRDCSRRLRRRRETAYPDAGGCRTSCRGPAVSPCRSSSSVPPPSSRARFLSPVPALRLVVDRCEVMEEAFGRGTIESQREATVGFDLAGRLSGVLVEEGARVSLGQAMARLETSQAEADLRFARTNIAAARSSLARLAADEQRARTQLAAAERDRARIAGLTDSGALPGRQRDDASDRARLAQAELDRVLAQRSYATRSIDVAAGGAEQRRVTMVRATLLAPFDGLVTRRLRDPGDTVTGGSAVFRIVDTKQAHASARERSVPGASGRADRGAGQRAQPRRDDALPSTPTERGIISTKTQPKTPHGNHRARTPSRDRRGTSRRGDSSPQGRSSCHDRSNTAAPP